MPLIPKTGKPLHAEQFERDLKRGPQGMFGNHRFEVPIKDASGKVIFAIPLTWQMIQGGMKELRIEVKIPDDMTIDDIMRQIKEEIESLGSDAFTADLRE